ncbi:MAG: hypothetical protein ACK559_24200, partial [bacterium]
LILHDGAQVGVLEDPVAAVAVPAGQQLVAAGRALHAGLAGQHRPRVAVPGLRLPRRPDGATGEGAQGEPYQEGDVRAQGLLRGGADLDVDRHDLHLSAPAPGQVPSGVLEVPGATRGDRLVEAIRLGQVAGQGLGHRGPVVGAELLAVFPEVAHLQHQVVDGLIAGVGDRGGEGPAVEGALRVFREVDLLHRGGRELHAVRVLG